MGLGMVRRSLDGPAVMGEGVIMLALVHQHVAQVGDRRRVIGVDVKRLAVIVDGAVRLAQPDVRVAEVVQSSGHPRPAFECQQVMLDGAFGVVSVQQSLTQVIVGFG